MSINPYQPFPKGFHPGNSFSSRLSFHHPNAALVMRQQAAARLAEQYCQATIDRFGTDEESVKAIFTKVQEQRLRPQFDFALQTLALQRGQKHGDAARILQQELKGNPLNRFFRAAPLKECQDILALGRNTYRASAMDYRLYGMYRSIADFIKVCKKHPIMSTGIIGAVFFLGHRYPFLGAASGVVILGWSAAVSAIHEVLALKQPGMDARKAAHYQSSGENLAAFGITFIGGKGIVKGTLNGYQQGAAAYRNVINKSGIGLFNSLKAAADGTLKAICSTMSEDRKLGLTEGFLFVSGLLDNVLLPFNWAADQLSNNKK